MPNFLKKQNWTVYAQILDLHLTEAGQFCLLEEQIEVHRYFMGLDYQRPVSYEEAVVHWYDTVFLPVVEIIRSQGLSRGFPNRSEGDLYLWIAEHRAALESELESPIDTRRAAVNLAEQFSQQNENTASRLGGWILNALIPDTLEAGPATGTWRKEKNQQGTAGGTAVGTTVGTAGGTAVGTDGVPLEANGYPSESCLFTDILVPVSGKEIGWKALEQAIVIARLESSRLTGLHIVPSRLINSSDALAVQNQFNRICSELSIPGKLILSPGPVARIIVERSRWSDLVVVNLSYPPSAQRLSKLGLSRRGSGFRELVLRCPRPILAVPGIVSNLSRALLAYDGSPKAEEALYVAAYLCGKWKIPLVVVSIFENTSQAQSIQSIQERAAEYLSSHGVKHRLVERQGPIAQAILIASEEENCDWIIMGGYGESPLVNLLLDTVVDQVLRSSHKPMLLCR